MNELTEVLTALKHVLFPKRCYFCGKVIPPDKEECEVCEKTVLRVEFPICYKCGADKKRCTCKKKRNRYVTAFAAPFYYCGAVRTSIHRLKFNGEKDVAKSLADEMASFVRSAYDGVDFDMITYVPMTKNELSDRGFNQSEIMASHLSRNLGLPCENVLSKLYETKRQRELKQRYRSGNVFGVFDVSKREKVRNKRILLCDDILTTGATLTECAKMLIVNGAREVMCITAAIGMPRKNGGEN